MSRRDLPEVRQRRGSPAPVPGKCGGKLALTDPPRYCTQSPRKGRSACKFHGGNSLAGLAHPGYRKGIYSESLQAGLRASYEQLLADDDLLSLRHEIATTRMFVREALATIQAGAWAAPAVLAAHVALHAAWQQFAAARRAGQAGRLRQAATVLEGAIVALARQDVTARGQAQARVEFRALVLTLERLNRSQNTNLDEQYNRITAERAWALQQAESSCFLEALEEMVPDIELRNAIRRRVATKFAELAHRRTHPALDAHRGPEPAAGDPAATD